jgi:hypothetical protein
MVNKIPYDFDVWASLSNIRQEDGIKTVYYSIVEHNDICSPIILDMEDSFVNFLKKQIRLYSKEDILLTLPNFTSHLFLKKFKNCSLNKKEIIILFFKFTLNV